MYKMYRTTRKLLMLTAIIGAFVLGFYFYFTRIGRVRATINEIFITSPNIPPVFDGVRIVQISDILIRNEASLDLLNDLAHRINELDADIIVFTGNLFLPEGLVFEHQAKEVLVNLNSNLVSVAVFGYHDIANDEQYELTENVLRAAGFEVLNNTSMEVFNQTAEAINVVGTAPMLNYRATNNLLDANVINNQFNVLLMSVPTFSSASIEHNIDLQLSGHCLGTQDSSHQRAACFQFYRGTYQFTDVLMINVSDGVARFHNMFGFTHRPSIDSFLLISEEIE